MIRVLHVIGPMTVGGAQTQLLGLVRAAHGELWHAAVCSTAPGPMVGDFRSAGVDVHELRRRGSPGVGRVLQLRRLVRGGEFDVVNPHLWFGIAQTEAAVAGLRRRPGIVAVEHNLERRRSMMRRAADRVLDRWADAQVAVTEAMGEFLEASHRLPPGTSHRIPYAVDRLVFAPAPLPDHDACLRIGAMGRLDPEKGHRVLIEASRQLSRRRIEHRVEVVGVGPLADALRRDAAGTRVSFVGPVSPGAGVAEFMRGLDVFVLPSTHREARPVVLLEALCCGVPVVATDIPGVPETVAGGADLVPPGDAAALADAIARVSTDPAARARARDAADSIPTFVDVARSYRDVF